ncbi:MAG: lysozyme [Bacteroidales bacterium]
MKKLKYLVIHCTATPEFFDVSSEQIRHWHLDQPPYGRGWKQIGYTDLFHLNGVIERLVANNEDANVDPWEITNGVVGINSVSRHIVYAGGLSADCETPKDTRTVGQKKALENYVKSFIKVHPDILIAGHNQFAAKACPSFDVPSWLKMLGVNPKNIYKP